MNEITNIHLGRQAFTISVDAHHALKAYLHAIGEQTGNNKEVVEEVELRIAELLREHGVTGEKVVILADINYVKEQLGEPADFSDAEEGGKPHDHKGREYKDESAPKRLFRDTDRAMVAGVASGLGAYIGVDPLIIRLIFVLLTLSGGAGILVYILLWVLVPAAESESDRLQMKGKPVTVENIKQAVDQADVPGAANRIAKLFEKVFLGASKLLLAIIGIGFVIAGIALMLAVSGIGSFTLVHGFQLGTTGPIIFPIGVKEVVAVVSGLAVVLVLAILSVLVGRAMIRRKWGVSGWVMAALIAIFVAGGGITAATIADSIDPVRTRYEAARHVEYREMPKFNAVQMNAGQLSTEIVRDGQYKVEINSFGDADTRGIKTSVENGVLTIDASKVRPKHACTVVCVYGTANMQIVVHAPRSIPIREVNVGEKGGVSYYDKNGDLLFVEPDGTTVPEAPETPETPETPQTLATPAKP